MPAYIRNSDRLDRKLGAFARGADLSPQLLLGAEVTRERYIDKVQNITGTSQQVRYDPKRTVTVSDPGQAPNNDTGNLVSRTETSRLRRNSVELSSNADYALALELGTSKMAPRPALGPAYDETLKLVVATVARAIAKSFRRP